MLLRARAVAPISTPPIDDGAVWLGSGRVRAAGPWKDLRRTADGPVTDLGDVVVLPGLVNAHCHLDYTDMAGQLVATHSFTDWIKAITTLKAGWSYSDFALSWLRGARMLLRSGTTTVGDIEAVPELLPQVRAATPLRVVSFLEMTGVRSRRQPGLILGETLAVLRNQPTDRAPVGLSPHAPYSTTPDLLRRTAAIAREHHLPVTVHVAESEEEFDMFVHGRGPMYEWLRRNERDVSDCGLGSPVQHLERVGALLPNLLAVHANYLAPGDASLLSLRGVHVVHCPQSHRFFQHEPFPLEVLAGAGVNLALGTDSLATTFKPRHQPIQLSLFDEMRTLAHTYPSLESERIVRMATLHGARALGMEHRVGELADGSAADLIALPFRASLPELWDAVVHHAGPVEATMIDGQWVCPSEDPTAGVPPEPAESP